LQGGHQDALEFEQWLLVENHIVQVLARNPSLAQTEINGLTGEAVIMLYTGEALLLGGGHQHTVF
jgi:hypothetical protein